LSKSLDPIGELYLFKVSEVKYAPAARIRVKTAKMLKCPQSKYYRYQVLARLKTNGLGKFHIWFGSLFERICSILMVATIDEEIITPLRSTITLDISFMMM
jgi:hypothetical protein